MRRRFLELIIPPKPDNYERAQRAKILHFTLIVIFVASIIIGSTNLIQGAIGLGVFIYSLSGFCLIGIYLNHKMYPNAAALILCGLLFFGMGYNLFDGAALHDPGVAAYPIFILCATYFFGQNASIFAGMASIVSVIAVYWFAEIGLISPSYAPTTNRVLVLSVLYITVSCLAWVIKNIWDETLSHLVQSYELTLQGWAQALEYRDQEIRGHSDRVTELCVVLAQKLGCSEDEIVNLRRGAYLHDIGKIALPDKILFKETSLDNEEWEIMKQHPEIAYDILSKIPFLKPALSIPHSHHENWGGSGYPQGLKGSEIPLIARIFTVVDQWDALSSDRPYRKAWPTNKIKTYIMENTGKIYDPEIAEEFLNLVDELEL